MTFIICFGMVVLGATCGALSARAERDYDDLINLYSATRGKEIVEPFK